MSHTSPGLEKGVYAYSAHSTFVSGDVMDVFVARWEDHPSGRALVKCQSDNLAAGELMCVIRLRRPMTLVEYGEAHHPDTRPLVLKGGTPQVEAVLLPASMACTIPDSMEIE